MSFIRRLAISMQEQASKAKRKVRIPSAHLLTPGSHTVTVKVAVVPGAGLTAEQAAAKATLRLMAQVGRSIAAPSLCTAQTLHEAAEAVRAAIPAAAVAEAAQVWTAYGASLDNATAKRAALDLVTGGLLASKAMASAPTDTALDAASASAEEAAKAKAEARKSVAKRLAKAA